MSYSSIIRESEDFGVALLDAEGRADLRVRSLDAAPARPDPRLRPRDQAALRGARRHVQRGRRHPPQLAVLRRVARARHRLLRAHLPARGARRLQRHDGAPPRRRGHDSGVHAASWTPSTPTRKGCSSRPSRSTTAASRTTWSGASCATTSARATWSWATWRRRSPLAISARSYVELLEEWGSRDGRGGLRGADGLLRAHAAAGDRTASGRDVQRRASSTGSPTTPTRPSATSGSR